MFTELQSVDETTCNTINYIPGLAYNLVVTLAVYTTIVKRHTRVRQRRFVMNMIIQLLRRSIETTIVTR